MHNREYEIRDVDGKVVGITDNMNDALYVRDHKSAPMGRNIYKKNDQGEWSLVAMNDVWLLEKGFLQDHSKLQNPQTLHWNKGALTVFYDHNNGWALGYERKDNFGRFWDLMFCNMTEEEIKLLVAEKEKVAND